MMTHEEYKEMIKKAASQFKTGKPIFGKDGAFHQVLEDFLNAALEAEMDVHLEKTKPENRENRLNGKMPKEIKTAYGAVQINTPRDREGSFNPEIVKKRQTVLAEGLADRIIGLYGLGQSMRDIQKYLEDDFGEYISADTISNITERVWPEINEWRTRRLETVYPIVWMDAIHYKVKDESGIVTTRAIYNVIGVDSNGYKDLLGMYVSQSEGAKFWMQVLSDLKNRGVEDILIACVDGLSGFPDAIESVFPKTNVQLCVVHQIRNSLKYINAKSQKEFLKELKLVYAASTKTEAEIALKKLEENWAKKYPIVIQSWKEKWDKLSCYFDYPSEIRRIIYTTNTVEGYHRQIRKVTKTKGLFPNDDSLVKLVYLAYRNIKKKWKKPLQNWTTCVQKLSILFGQRFNPLNLNQIPK